MKSLEQKRMFGLVTTTLLSLAMLAGSVSWAFASESDGVALTARIQLQSEDPTDTLTESVTVHLLAEGEETASAQATSANGYKVEFGVPLPEKAAPDYSIQIDPVDGYTEDVSQHVDPVLTFICPVEGDWTKYEPCNELSIPTDRLGHEIIAAKTTKHGPMIIWTPEAMTSTEQQMIVNSVMKNPGVGNPSSTIFVVGNAVTEYGLSINVNEGKVLMDRPSDWSLLFGGEYTKSSAEVLDGQIVLTPVKIPETDPPVVDEPTPDDPTVDNPTGDDPTVDDPTVDDPTVDDPTGNDPTGNDPIVDTPPKGGEPTIDDPVLDGPEDPTVDVPEQIPDVEPDQPIVESPGEDKTAALPGESIQSKGVGRSIPQTGVETEVGAVAAATLLILAAAGLTIALRVRKNKQE